MRRNTIWVHCSPYYLIEGLVLYDPKKPLNCIGILQAEFMVKGLRRHVSGACTAQRTVHVIVRRNPVSYYYYRAHAT